MVVIPLSLEDLIDTLFLLNFLVYIIIELDKRLQIICLFDL